MDEQKASSEDKESEASADENASDGACEPEENDPINPDQPNPTTVDEAASVSIFNSGSKTRCCALCNCGEWSPQGQRELVHFDPSPDKPVLIPGPSSVHNSASDSQLSDPSIIGFPESVSSLELFEPTGHCWVHYWCASWSSGVKHLEGNGMINVDKAVYSGISQKCEYCKRMGATIQCHSTGCMRRYHFPCAAASGSFQSMKTLKLLCTEHLGEAVAIDDSQCVLCEKPGDLIDLLFCTSCGLHYHGSCLEISVSPLKRAGWQCPECKVCQTCRHPGEDTMMLVCDACDKGYHTFCLKPAIECLPADSWKCKACRICHICGSRTPQLRPGCQWYDNYSVCEKCQERRNQTEPSIMCNHSVPQERCIGCSKLQKTVCTKVVETCIQEKGNEVSNTELSECEAKPLGLSNNNLDLPQKSVLTEMSTMEPISDSVSYEVFVTTEDTPCSSDNEAAEAPPICTVTLREESPPPLEAEPPPQETTLDACDLLEEAPILVTVEDEEMETEEGSTETHNQKEEINLLPVSLDSHTATLTSVCDTHACSLVNEDSDKGSADTVNLEELSCSSPVKATCCPQQTSLSDSEMAFDSEEPPCQSSAELLNSHSAFCQDRVADYCSHKVHTSIRPTLIKSDIVNEISNLSQGDTTGSFHGSDALGSPDPEGGSLSMEMCLQKEDESLRLCNDSITETDDSLLYDPSGAKLDGEKTRRRSSPGRSRVKQGRSSSFPGRRRARGTSGVGTSRGRGRSRLKSTTSSIETLPMADVESSPSKDDEEEEDDTMQNTVVLFSNTDKFVLMQDMCVVCGSFGRGSEGHLLACSQCSQCYHPYCVNSKITKVMLLKGWRCVECIVCEVCGKATDPSRLLLCDDCDISYHTYCLDPPLHTVPKGGWKCRWCVCCMQCGAVTPGFRAEWQNNYTHCAPCASLVSCPICHVKYLEGDLLIQCRHCERWLHAVCENLFTEEEVEQAADEGFDCTSCQPFIPKPVVIIPESPAKIKETEPQYFRFEGVWLTEAGMSVLRSLTLSPLQKKKPRRSRLCTGGEIFMDCSDQTGAEERKEGEAECDELKSDICNIEPMECDIKIEPLGSPEREAGIETEAGKCMEDTEDVKKKKRKPYRPGIGGFMIRQRKTHTRSKKGHAAFLEAFRESQIQDIHTDEAVPPETPTENGPDMGVTESDDKKKRRGRKKSKLEDMFPAYLQEAFFGKDLMDLSRQAILAAHPVAQKAKPTPSAPLPSHGSLQTSQAPLQSTAHVVETVSVSTPAAQLEDSDNGDMKAENPEMPKMKSTDIHQMLKDVLGPTEQEQTLNLGSSRMEGSVAETTGQHHQSFFHGVAHPPLQMESFSQPGFMESRDRNTVFSPEHCDTDSSWPTASTPTTPTEGENDGLSYNQRSLQRWEKDEELGELSTISPVLYANKNFPNLKVDYPDWASRCKQIMKLWRKVPAPDKAPYLQKAKDNRAAHRINKVQKQAENQINKQSKGDCVPKIERPVLQIQIPGQSGGVSEFRTGVPAAKDSCVSSGSRLSTSSDLFLKPSSAGADSPSDVFFKLPTPSPSQDNFTNSSAYTLDPRYQSSIGQSPASCGAFQTIAGVENHPCHNTHHTTQNLDYQISHPSTPHRQPHTPEPFIKPRYPTGSLDNLTLVGSPTARVNQSSENSSKPAEPMLSPSRYGDLKRQADGILHQIKKEDAGSPGFVHNAISVEGTMEMKCDVFKAPLTPRMAQIEPHSPASSHREAHIHTPVMSPQHHSDLYRPPSTAPYTDPYSQPPLTPRPQTSEGSCTLTPRSLSSDSFTRVPTSPQSQASSQSPLTPRPLSAEAFCQSPVTPRFQSPDPYSRPPSRPHSQDPFAPMHKPSRPQVSEQGFKPAAQLSHSTSVGLSFQVSQEVHPKITVNQQQSSVFARSPGASVLPNSQTPLCFTFPHSPGDVKSSPSHQPSFPSSHSTNSSFHPNKPQSYQSPSNYTPLHPSSSPHSSGNSSTSEIYAQSPHRPPSVLPQETTYQPTATSQRQGLISPSEKQKEEISVISNSIASTAKEVQELQNTSEPALSSLSQTELERQRQRQRLRELLIRQQIQRNTLRQEKEAAAATLSSSHPGWSTEEKANLGVIPTPSVANKLPNQSSVSFLQEDRLNAPLSNASPGAADNSERQSTEVTQSFYARGTFPDQPQMWQSPVAAQRALAPVRFQEVNRPSLPPSVSSGGVVRLTFPGEQITSSSVTVGGAPYIELRHHGQKLPIGAAFNPSVLQNRPRFYLSSQGTNSPLEVPVMRSPLLQAQKSLTSNPLSLSNAVNVVAVQQPIQPKGNTVCETSQHQTTLHTQSDGLKDASATSIDGGRVTCDDTPELDVDFDTHKDLEDDDLANLSLDVAKADDELDNLDNLETNDPHLDDLLNGDEFDLLAYTDPELDNGDKKDIFNEHLRLVESANEKAEEEAMLKTEPDISETKKDTSTKKLQQEMPVNSISEATNDRLSDNLGIELGKRSHAGGLKDANIETKQSAYSGNLKPKVEDSLKTSNCQFSTSNLASIKTESPHDHEKSLLGTFVKSTSGHQTISVCPTQASNHGASVIPSKDTVTPILAGQTGLMLEKFDLDDSTLNLQGSRQSPSDDLDKMESSLVASELPLLIEDLLEHEKNEQQKKQLMSGHHPEGAQQHTMITHSGLHVQQPQDSQQAGLAGLVSRHSGLTSAPPILSPQHPIQQRISGVQISSTIDLAVSGTSGQNALLGGQHLVQTGISQTQCLSPKQIIGQQIGMKPPHLVLQQQQMANSIFPDTDLDKFVPDDIMDPIAKAKMVALKGIKKVMAQGSIGVTPGINSRQQVSLLAQRLGVPGATEATNQTTAGNTQERTNIDAALPRPNPPAFVQGVINEADQRQYEEWLFHTQQLLQMQLKVLEEQIGVHRKSRKALCAKQRTAKKAGREFPEADAEKLKLVTEQQSKIQKQLDQVRKQQKEHTNLMAEYRNKQQQQQQGCGVLPVSPTQNSRVLTKAPGQLISGHITQAGSVQHNPLTGQSSNLRNVQSNLAMQTQQGPYVKPIPQQQQTQGGNPAIPGTSSGFYQTGSTLHNLTAEQRAIQERQIQQQRMQLAQKLQNQHQGFQLSPQGSLPQTMLGNPPGLVGDSHGLLAQQASQPQEALLRNPLSSVLQHQPIQQKQILITQPLQRVLGSSPVAQSQSMAGQRLLLSQQQQNMLSLSQMQQQSSVTQPINSVQQTIIGQLQSTSQSTSGQPQNIQNSKEVNMSENVLLQEGKETQGLQQHAVVHQNSTCSPVSQNMMNKQSRDQLNLGSNGSLNHEQESADLGTMDDLQQQMQQHNLILPQSQQTLQNLVPLGKIDQVQGTQNRSTQETSRPPSALSQQNIGTDQQPSLILAQRITGQGQPQVNEIKGDIGLHPPGQQRIALGSQHTSHTANFIGQQNASLMNHIRAQLQSIIAKNPHLRHLTAQQQQQLQAILIQRHQQSQNQALRQGSFQELTVQATPHAAAVSNGTSGDQTPLRGIFQVGQTVPEQAQQTYVDENHPLSVQKITPGQSAATHNLTGQISQNIATVKHTGHQSSLQYKTQTVQGQQIVSTEQYQLQPQVQQQPQQMTLQQGVHQLQAPHIQQITPNQIQQVQSQLQQLPIHLPQPQQSQQPLQQHQMQQQVQQHQIQQLQQVQQQVHQHQIQKNQQTQLQQQIPQSQQEQMIASTQQHLQQSLQQSQVQQTSQHLQLIQTQQQLQQTQKQVQQQIQLQQTQQHMQQLQQPQKVQQTQQLQQAQKMQQNEQKLQLTPHQIQHQLLQQQAQVQLQQPGQQLVPAQLLRQAQHQVQQQLLQQAQQQLLQQAQQQLLQQAQQLKQTPQQPQQIPQTQPQAQQLQQHAQQLQQTQQQLQQTQQQLQQTQQQAQQQAQQLQQAQQQAQQLQQAQQQAQQLQQAQQQTQQLQQAQQQDPSSCNRLSSRPSSFNTGSAADPAASTAQQQAQQLNRLSSRPSSHRLSRRPSSATDSAAGPAAATGLSSRPSSCNRLQQAPAACQQTQTQQQAQQLANDSAAGQQLPNSPAATKQLQQTQQQAQQLQQTQQQAQQLQQTQQQAQQLQQTQQQAQQLQQTQQQAQQTQQQAQQTQQQAQQTQQQTQQLQQLQQAQQQARQLQQAQQQVQQLQQAQQQAHNLLQAQQQAKQQAQQQVQQQEVQQQAQQQVQQQAQQQVQRSSAQVQQQAQQQVQQQAQQQVQQQAQAAFKQQAQRSPQQAQQQLQQQAQQQLNSRLSSSSNSRLSSSSTQALSSSSNKAQQQLQHNRLSSSSNNRLSSSPTTGSAAAPTTGSAAAPTTGSAAAPTTGSAAVQQRLRAAQNRLSSSSTTGSAAAPTTAQQQLQQQAQQQLQQQAQQQTQLPQEAQPEEAQQQVQLPQVHQILQPQLQGNQLLQKPAHHILHTQLQQAQQQVQQLQQQTPMTQQQQVHQQLLQQAQQQIRQQLLQQAQQQLMQQTVQKQQLLQKTQQGQLCVQQQHLQQIQQVHQQTDHQSSPVAQQDVQKQELTTSPPLHLIQNSEDVQHHQQIEKTEEKKQAARVEQSENDQLPHQTEQVQQCPLPHNQVQQHISPVSQVPSHQIMEHQIKSLQSTQLGHPLQQLSHLQQSPQVQTHSVQQQTHQVLQQQPIRNQTPQMLQQQLIPHQIQIQKLQQHIQLPQNLSHNKEQIHIQQPQNPQLQQVQQNLPQLVNHPLPQTSLSSPQQQHEQQRIQELQIKYQKQLKQMQLLVNHPEQAQNQSNQAKPSLLQTQHQTLQQTQHSHIRQSLTIQSSQIQHLKQNQIQQKQLQQLQPHQIQQVHHILQLKQQMLNQPPEKQLQLQQQLQMHLQKLRQQMQLEHPHEPKREPIESTSTCSEPVPTLTQKTSPEGFVTVKADCNLSTAISQPSNLPVQSNDNLNSDSSSTKTISSPSFLFSPQRASDSKSVEFVDAKLSRELELEQSNQSSCLALSPAGGNKNFTTLGKEHGDTIEAHAEQESKQTTNLNSCLENGEKTDFCKLPKQEPTESGVLSHQGLKNEADSEIVPLGAKTEAGHLLLQKLLRAKTVQLASQRSSDSLHADINGHIDSKLSVLEQKLQGGPRNKEDVFTAKKTLPKSKRPQKANEKIPNSRKKIRREDSLKSPDDIMKQLKQELSLLPLVEPSITANFSLFAPFGSGSPISGKCPLKGSFGSGALESIPDYYTQLLSKNNLSNPPTPPSSLPPTPPPSVQQKMVNGITAAEDLSDANKESESNETEIKKGTVERSLDLLAALPTPPHNQSEDVRMESDEESDVPDNIVPASSPESVLGEETPRFPTLCEVKEEQEERALSPVIPLIPLCSIPAFPDVKTTESLTTIPEHSGKMLVTTGGHVTWDKAKGSEVSVMLTVSTAAAKSLNGVVAAVAGLLSIKLPSSYEIIFPDQGLKSSVEIKKPDNSPTDGESSEKEKLSQTKNDNSTDWLKQLDAVLPGYTLKNELDILTLLTQEETLGEKKPALHCYINNVSNLDVRQLPVLPEVSSPPPSPLVPSPSTPEETPAAEPDPLPLSVPSPVPPLISPDKEDSKDMAKMKQRARPSEECLEEPKPRVKKWKGVRWKRLHILITFQKISSRHCEKEICEVIERLGTTLKPETLPPDLRKCCFCHEEGDGATDGPGRLLNLDLDLWVHLNCALWSTEVYETQGGALINVEVALHRGLLTKCSLCQKTGATNSCNRLRCPNVYHFACAIRAKCMFFKDKTMLCPMHKLKGPCDQELNCFTVFRRVYIERDEVNQIASIIQRGDRIHMFRVGGLVFHAIGQLLPHQMQDFHSVTALYPVGFEVTRIYWSMRHSHRRCSYRCRVCDNNGQPEFSVQVIEYGYEDVVLTDSSPQALWSRVAEPVARMRRETGMLRLFPEYLKGEEMFGLTLHAVLRIAESLPGVENCQNYLFRYGKHPLMELPLMINPTGCARSEPKIMTHYKRPHTLNSTSMSKAYQSTFTGETNTPYSKQFVHSKSSQYRRLKTEWKNNVYLARSRIQGLGLYASKDLEKHTMVIEYIGTIIRNEVANRREKIYEEQNRGIYMFRINNEHVIDATLTGGPARYINHSCAPNCVAEVVTFDKEDKIIIISSRRIPKGEELTYDYQFDFEDDQHKIPCHCGAWNCRKWMN
ncbi:hypothetical protein GDO86_004250 [Hymenochirus boettgeri]|uniref:Histone-lysine N-methyltransferase 2C n=1 Tax=Hymenochirus boettgeri TaxID=247094 RepID=A0A8T2K924_9PIPI|nr:hypothetical protein GDO86_004250 [Hymenochirus boettgeri]